MKRYALIGAVAAALLLASFAVGRYSAPKPSIKTVTVERVVTKEVKGEDKTLHETKTVVVYRDRIIHKDGTVEDKSETKTTVGLDTKDHTTDAVDTSTSKQATLEIKTSRADWHVGLLVGTPVLTPSLLLGVQVERRILGPFYAGVWALNPTNGFKPTVGLSLGVVF